MIAFAVLIVGCSESAVSDPSTPTSAPAESANSVTLDCSTQSMADFGDAFADSRNLVVGPLVLLGAGMPTPEAVVLAHDGQKFPLLLKPGHTVTLELPSRVRDTAGLAYGPFPDGRVAVNEAHDTITFVACSRDEAGSTAGGPVTFWSGFVMTTVPTCLPLDVHVDDDVSPRRVVIALGKDPCPQT